MIYIPSISTHKILFMDSMGPINGVLNAPPAKVMIAKMDRFDEISIFEILCFRPDKRLNASLKGFLSSVHGLQKIFSFPIENNVGTWKIIVTITINSLVEAQEYEIIVPATIP